MNQLIKGPCKMIRVRIVEIAGYLLGLRTRLCTSIFAFAVCRRLGDGLVHREIPVRKEIGEVWKPRFRPIGMNNHSIKSIGNPVSIFNNCPASVQNAGPPLLVRYRIQVDVGNFKGLGNPGRLLCSIPRQSHLIADRLDGGIHNFGIIPARKKIGEVRDRRFGAIAVLDSSIHPVDNPVLTVDYRLSCFQNTGSHFLRGVVHIHVGNLLSLGNFRILLHLYGSLRRNGGCNCGHTKQRSDC